MAPKKFFLEDEYKAPWEAYKADASSVNAGSLLKAVEPVIAKGIKTYGGATPGPTLRSRAKILTLEAAKQYDPYKSKLQSHLLTQMQRLQRYARQESQPLKIPEQMALDLIHFNRSKSELSDYLDRDPSSHELAQHLGVSMARLNKLRAYRPPTTEGQMFTQAARHGIEDFVGPAVRAQDTRADDAWTDYVYGDLEPIDQAIMEHSLGLYGNPRISGQEIAKKLRLSPGAVSQRAARIQQLLDQQDELGFRG